MVGLCSRMFRNARDVSSACPLGTHRSVFGTFNNFMMKNFGETVYASLICQPFHMVSCKSGSKRKHHYISEPNNSKYVLKKQFLYHGSSISTDTADLSVCKRNISEQYCPYTTLLDHFIFRDCSTNKYKLHENNTGTQRPFLDECRAEIIHHSKSHRNDPITWSTSYCKSLITKRLRSCYHEQWNRHGSVKSQIRGLHRRVPQQAAFEDCLSVQNEERCRRHLQSNTSLYKNEQGKKSWAAVLVCLCTVGGEPALLFTLRSSKLRGRHKGDVSFAGGKQDPSDRTVEETALREAREELGINVTKNEVWGVLKPLNDMSGMLIAPVLANLGPVETLSLRPNPCEVEEIFTLTVAHLCNPENQGYTHFRTGDHYGYTLPVFRSQKYKIWGLTAIALDHTLKLIMPE